MYSTSYTYANLSRLFIRLFVGIMFLQFGIRQAIYFDICVNTFPAVLGLSQEYSLILMIAIELICSSMIMLGFLTRLATIPAIITMFFAEYNLLTVVTHEMPFHLSYMQPGFLPIMFLGIFFYILLAGPGKISMDYLLSLHIINQDQLFQEDDKLKEA